VVFDIRLRAHEIDENDVEERRDNEDLVEIVSEIAGPRMLITYEEELPGDPLECNWASDKDDETGKV
jgi:hypothetical protein